MHIFVNQMSMTFKHFLPLSFVVYFFPFWISPLVSNNTGSCWKAADLLCLIWRQMKDWRMQVREPSNYKKPHQSRDVWRDAFPELRTGKLLLSVLESRCAARHSGRGLIWQHISLSALTSSPHPFPLLLPCVWACERRPQWELATSYKGNPFKMSSHSVPSARPDLWILKSDSQSRKCECQELPEDFIKRILENVHSALRTCTDHPF